MPVSLPGDTPSERCEREREIAVCRTSFFKGRHVAEASQIFVAHADGEGGFAIVAAALFCCV